MMDLRHALDRTLLLMRDDVGADTQDWELIAALMSVKVALVADARNLASHSAQSAFVTAAMLMARSAHQVYLIADDVPLVCPQPPLGAGGAVSALFEISDDLLPGIRFAGAPPCVVDLQILFGDSCPRVAACRTVSVNASAWSARMSARPAVRWPIECWPLGGLALAGSLSVEAFKIAMRRLRMHANNPKYFDALFADVPSLDFSLASPNAARPSALGSFDLISGGAIANSALYVLSRIPNVTGQARVWDDDVGNITNMNRNTLLLRSQANMRKVDALAAAGLGNLAIHGVPERFSRASRIGRLSRALVGVDHIPSRWDAQRAKPQWLGVGATSHWACMASFHSDGLACAGCLHPRDDPNDTVIPTVAFVSYWAGLLLAAYFIRDSGGEELSLGAQQVYFSPLRPEYPMWMPVPRRQDCPVHGEREVAI